MKIVHISDWHGQLTTLPSADLYVVTGDMMTNFPLVKFQTAQHHGEIVTHDPFADPPVPRPAGHYVGRILEPEREAIKQAQWCLSNPFRRATGISDDAPVVVVKGNHDFISLSDWINGDVWEATSDPTRFTNLFGLKIGGCRGINYIEGEWDDEIDLATFNDRTDKLPDDLDILITHSPPFGIQDVGRDRTNWGSGAIAHYLNSRCYSNLEMPKAHFFGHVHEDFGQRKLGGTTYSNAATGIQIVEL